MKIDYRGPARGKDCPEKETPRHQGHQGEEGTTDADNTTDPVAQAQAGKALAVWLYQIGAADLAETQARFDRHPSWRTA